MTFPQNTSHKMLETIRETLFKQYGNKYITSKEWAVAKEAFNASTDNTEIPTKTIKDLETFNTAVKEHFGDNEPTGVVVPELLAEAELTPVETESITERNTTDG